MNHQEFLLHQNVKKWNVVATLFFLLIILFLYFIIGFDLQKVKVSFYDIFILSFANYRLIRLFIYDNITLFLREFFMDLEESNGKYFYISSVNSFKLTIHKLLNCPWCFGVWTTFLSGFLYFNFASFRIIFILLAISSAASFMILLSNFIGWSAELKKMEAHKSK